MATRRILVGIENRVSEMLKNVSNQQMINVFKFLEAAWSTTQIRSISYEEKQKKQRTHAQKMIDMFDLPTKKKKFETRKPFDYSGKFFL